MPNGLHICRAGVRMEPSYKNLASLLRLSLSSYCLNLNYPPNTAPNVRIPNNLVASRGGKIPVSPGSSRGGGAGFLVSGSWFLVSGFARRSDTYQAMRRRGSGFWVPVSGLPSAFDVSGWQGMPVTRKFICAVKIKIDKASSLQVLQVQPLK